MQTILIECAVRASLIAAVIALVLWMMRIKTASVQHAVWASIVVLMMLLPAWVACGPKAPLPVLPPELGQTKTILGMPLVDAAVGAPVQQSIGNAAPQHFVRNWPTFLAGGYLLGLCTLFLRLVIGTVRVNSLLKNAVVRDGRLTHSSCVTPVTVGWVQPSVILPVSWSEWPQAQLEAVLVHEREHARRRDPLFQWIALLNRALFWFHPLAWWLERRLSGLAEEACDTAVVSQGHDPRAYAEYLLDLARCVERVGARVEVVGMAMPGGFLPQRIRRMLSGVPVPARISRPRMVCTVAVCASAAAILAAGTVVHAQQSATRLEFEVASVKPMAAGDHFGPRFGCMPNGTFVSHQPLREVLLLAFDIKPFQLVGVPDWDPVVLYDAKGLYAIEAKASGPVTEAQCKLMVQSLLADRYKMVAHREQREIPVYALVVGKNGPKLKKALDTDTTGNNIILNGNPMGIAAGRPADFKDPGWSIANLADFLRIAVDRPVVDRTGVGGNYRINLNFSISNFATAAEPPAGAGPDIRTALQEQLGLRLEATKAPFEMIIIDHIEKPTGN